MNLQPGSKIGDYEVISQLGAGGMGRVYKVRNELSDRLEAMKVLLPDLEGQGDLANRFLREIKTQAGLNHPNIAKLYTAARIDNQLLMFMELVDGITLDERLKQGPIPIADAVHSIAQVLSALDYAHQRGVVHRDIKPANMMMLPDGTVKLLDFGIAKAAADHRLTMTGTTLGSLYYMSPEQIQGSHVDNRSDLYSVGVSLYEMVTGKKPFDGESQFAIMSAHLARSPVAPVEMNGNLPPALSEIILVALNKDPAGRFQTAGAFLQALASVQPEAAALPDLPPAAPGDAPARTGSTLPPLPRTSPTSSITAPLTGPVSTGSPLRGTTAGLTAGMVPPPPQPGATRQQPYNLIEPTEPPDKKTAPKRIIWVAAGGLCAALAIVAFIQFGPRNKTSAKETTNVDHSTSVAPPTLNTSSSKQQPDASPSVSQPANSGKPSAMPEGRKPRTDRAQVQGSSKAPDRAPNVAQQTPPDPQPQVTQQQPPPAQPQNPPGSPQRSQADSVLAPVSNQGRMDIEQLRGRLDKLYARASVIRDQLAQIQRAQEAQGVGMRSDWVTSFNLMNGYLRRANEALNGGDGAAAAIAITNADNQLSSLEKAMGR